MVKPNVLILGATGYLGSTFLMLLGQDPDTKDRFHITALCRNSQQRLPELEKLYPDISVIECTLDSGVIIEEQSAEADIVINAASSDHLISVSCMISPRQIYHADLTLPVIYGILWIISSDTQRPREKVGRQPRQAAYLHPYLRAWHNLRQLTRGTRRH
jgi:hypothetical protein